MTETSTDEPSIGVGGVARYLWTHFSHYRAQFVALVGLGLVVALLEAVIVVMIAALASLLTNAGDELSKTVLGISITISRADLCVLALVVVVVRAAFEFVLIELRARTDAAYDGRSRRAVIDAFLESDWELQSVEQAGGLQTTVIPVVTQARGAMRGITDTIGALLGLVVMLVFSAAVAGFSALVVIVVLGGAALAVRPLLRSSHESARRMWAYTASFAVRIDELVGLAREIRVFDATRSVEEATGRDIDGLAESVHKQEASAFRLTAVNNNLIYLCAIGGLVALIATGVDNPQPYVAMVLLLFRAVQYARTVQSNYQTLLTTMPNVVKLDEQIARYRAAARPSGTEVLERPLRSLRFDHVSFAYQPGQSALEGVDFELTPGEAVGIVGPSGSGKSTLVQLLLGLRRPTAGRVLVNGRSPQDYTRGSWASLVTLVPQDAHLFDRSVRDNIVCFRNGIGDDEVVEAARSARILDEIQALPEGFDTPIGSGTGRLSGGQRQRLCIARALAGGPAVVVLDEPTSALDLASEDAIRCTLEALKGAVTLVIIAHRMSTLRICDRVIVVDGGRVEAVGSRSDLERDNAYYAEAVRLSKLA